MSVLTAKKMESNILLDNYLAAKERWRENVGSPYRYRLKEAYQRIEKVLYDELPDEFHYQGSVIKKGHNNFGVYLQVFTEESFARAENYRKSHTEK